MAGVDERVTLRNRADGRVIADAVRDTDWRASDVRLCCLYPSAGPVAFNRRSLG